MSRRYRLWLQGRCRGLFGTRRSVVRHRSEMDPEVSGEDGVPPRALGVDTPWPFQLHLLRGQGCEVGDR